MLSVLEAIERRQSFVEGVAANWGACVGGLREAMEARAEPDDSGFSPKNAETIATMYWEAICGELYLLRGDAERELLRAFDQVPATNTLRRRLFRSRSGILLVATEERRPVLQEVKDVRISSGRRDGEVVERSLEFLAGVAWRTQGLDNGPGGAIVFGIGEAAGGWRLGPVSTTRWSWGAELGEVAQHNAMVESANQLLLASLLFVEQGLADTERRGLSRSELRHWAGEIPEDRGVTTIVLREKIRRRERGEETGRKVRRHFRAEHWNTYHVNRDHELADPFGPEKQTIGRWIPSAIVGRPDMPLKPVAERVFDVRR